MIRNQWHAVLNSKQVKKKPIGMTRLGENLVFWGDEAGSVNCAVDCCPHHTVALSLEEVYDDHLQCPFHGFE